MLTCIELKWIKNPNVMPLHYPVEYRKPPLKPTNISLYETRQMQLKKPCLIHIYYILSCAYYTNYMHIRIDWINKNHCLLSKISLFTRAWLLIINNIFEWKIHVLNSITLLCLFSRWQSIKMARKKYEKIQPDTPEKFYRVNIHIEQEKKWL